MATIQKWGNSLAVRIPTALAEQLHVIEGTSVQVRVAKGALVVEPVARPKYRLSELLTDCKPRQLHGEDDWGTDVGREVVE